MIKTWHKWFVCIFAAVFVSIFFMYDAIFINASSGSSVVTPPIIIADDNIDDDKPDTPTPKPDDDTKEDDNKEEVTIPTYTNAFVCLNDALARFNNAQNYTASFASSANSFGVVQNIKGNRKKANNDFYLETFAFCDSSFGQTWYERVTSADGNKNFEYIKTKNVDSSFKYDLDEATATNYTAEEFVQKFGKKAEMFTLIPQKGIDKASKFDRDTNKHYYIATFTFNIAKLPKFHIETMLKEGNAKSINYSSLKITYFISKKTGQIEKVEQDEIYKIDVGINASVNYKYVAQIKY